MHPRSVVDEHENEFIAMSLIDKRIMGKGFAVGTTESKRNLFGHVDPGHIASDPLFDPILIFTVLPVAAVDQSVCFTVVHLKVFVGGFVNLKTGHDLWLGVTVGLLRLRMVEHVVWCAQNKKISNLRQPRSGVCQIRIMSFDQS